MDFVCVMSVRGRLLSFDVEQRDGNYRARLRNVPEHDDDLFRDVMLERQNGGWKADIDDEEVINNLLKCIDAEEM